jgi:hypothetical protein
MSNNTYWLDVSKQFIEGKQSQKIIVGYPYGEDCKIVDVHGVFLTRVNGYGLGYPTKQLRTITIQQENTDHE